MSRLSKLAAILGLLIGLSVPAFGAGDGIFNPGSGSGGSFPPSGCSTANGVIFNNATPCDSGFIYAGSGGAVTQTGTAAANTSFDGYVLTNPTAASSGNQQFSPRLRLTGQGWKTNATAASQEVDWIIENQPQQGTTTPTSWLVFSYNLNNAGYVPVLRMAQSLVGSPYSPVAYVSGNGGFGISREDLYPNEYASMGVLAGNLTGFATDSGGHYSFSNSTSSLTTLAIGISAPSGTKLQVDNNSSTLLDFGVRWLTTQGETRVTTPFTATSNVTPANITGLSVTVLAGGTYAFEADLYTTSNVGAGIQVAIAGTATATAITYDCTFTDGGSLVSPITGTQRSSALGSAVGATAATNAWAKCQGTITVNAGGTLTVQFAQNVSNASASTVLAGSTFIVNSF